MIASLQLGVDRLLHVALIGSIDSSGNGSMVESVELGQSYSLIVLVMLFSLDILSSNVDSIAVTSKKAVVTVCGIVVKFIIYCIQLKKIKNIKDG